MLLSGYFRRAFGQDLIVFRPGGSHISLLVGDRPQLQVGEDRLSSSYLARTRTSALPLKDQGDGMRSFASVILYLLASPGSTVLLLDEPEAFLHPPQARLLGELIATERQSQAQLFVATHSPDVLTGLLSAAPDHLRVLRIQRDGDVNRIAELDKNRARRIANDPLMKYSSVLSGVFHERVIICESEADCAFYSALLDLPEVHGERRPDVFFAHANGKDRVARLAGALRELDVPVDIILDIDVLRTEEILRDTVQVLGGDWASVKPMADLVRKAVEDRKPGSNAVEIRQEIEGVLTNVDSPDAEFSRTARKKIETILKRTNCWDVVKEAGENGIPSGQATTTFRKLLEVCKSAHLWIVPVGELEGFNREVGGRSSKWVQVVLEQRELARDPLLKRARDFVRELWTFGG